MLQRLEHSGRTFRGEAGLEKPGTLKKGPPGELAKNSQQPVPPAPPQPRPAGSMQITQEPHLH